VESFGNVELEKDGDDKVLHRVKDSNTLHTIKRKKG
jgi:hypothetical protein